MYSTYVVTVHTYVFSLAHVIIVHVIKSGHLYQKHLFYEIAMQMQNAKSVIKIWVLYQNFSQPINIEPKIRYDKLLT